MDGLAQIVGDFLYLLWQVVRFVARLFARVIGFFRTRGVNDPSTRQPTAKDVHKGA
jgi:hypothetical protein